MIDTKQFFNNFFTHQVSFPSEQIDVVIAFFMKRNFDEDSSRSITIILLNQARVDNVNIFQLIDTMKGLTDIQLSNIIIKIINVNGNNTNILGYKVNSLYNDYESRNVLI